MTQTKTTERAKRQRTLVGKVVSNKMDKTIVVLVERRVKHPVLGKIIMRSAKYKAHDETNQFNEGDPSDRGGDETISFGGVDVVAHPAKRIIATKMTASGLDTQPLCET